LFQLATRSDIKKLKQIDMYRRKPSVRANLATEAAVKQAEN